MRKRKLRKKFKEIEQVRNDVAHANNYAMSFEQAEQLRATLAKLGELRRQINSFASEAASSLAPSYDLAFTKNRAAASSLPPCLRPRLPNAITSERIDLPLKKRIRTSSRRASSTHNARKRATRMSPLRGFHRGVRTAASRPLY